MPLNYVVCTMAATTNTMNFKKIIPTGPLKNSKKGKENLNVNKKTKKKSKNISKLHR